MKNINTSLFDQCHEKNYAAPYAADARQVWYVALNYSAFTRTLDDPLCERVWSSRTTVRPPKSS